MKDLVFRHERTTYPNNEILRLSFAPAQNDVNRLHVILSGAKDPYDDLSEVGGSQGFSPFGYAVVAPEGAQNDIFS